MDKEQFNFSEQSSAIRISLDIHMNYLALQALPFLVSKFKTN